MSATMKIIGLVSGHTTPFDDQYLVEFDPDIEGVDPFGRPMSAHIVTTSDRSKAKQYANATDAFAEWKRVPQREPIRYDGKPNRPLTAFSVEIE